MISEHMEYLEPISQPLTESSTQHEDAEVSIYKDGNIATLSLGGTESIARFRKVVSAVDSSSKRAMAGKRQKVKGFSRSSRKNFMRILAMLRSIVDSLFSVTLTVPDDIIESHYSTEELTAYVRKSLDRFLDRLEYRYPNLGCIWHIEFERRNSGKYKGRLVPHFHLLIYIPKDAIIRMPSLTRLGVLRQQIAMLWHKAVRSDDPDHLAAGTQVKPVNWRKDRVRITKYLSKAAGEEDEMCVGRRWGIRGKKNLPWDEPIKIVLPRRQGLRLWSFFRTFLNIPTDVHWRLPSLTIFINSSWLLANLPRLVT